MLFRALVALACLNAAGFSTSILGVLPLNLKNADFVSRYSIQVRGAEVAGDEKTGQSPNKVGEPYLYPSPPDVNAALYANGGAKTVGTISPSLQVGMSIAGGKSSQIGGGYAEAEADIQYSAMAVRLPCVPIPPFGCVSPPTGSMFARAHGKVSAYKTGDAAGTAKALMDVSNGAATQIAAAAIVSADAEDEFNLRDFGITFIPDLPFLVHINAKVRVSVQDTGTVYAIASVDPIFELAPESRPYFQLVYSPNLDGATDIPEPSTIILAGSALLCTAACLRRRSSSRL